ncbi:hypothetical protein CRG98_046221 [Punica granatum]|uniref:Disease resistance protein Roq1-like winged-helix domain-containing protein n=1 Tax=Punica granatum TaxID=22663 RepID=A0A2I0HNS8_PUNGR|nr:hypothetical protein CRG98_046221 [Punica granatum]
MDIWEGTLEKLKQIPDAEVKETLMISYESLDESEKEIFLEIACFFIGKDQRIAHYMWENHKFIAIKTLISQSLAKIGDNSVLWMHDFLRYLGREIVRNESPDEPGKCSRLWNHEDAISTLQNRKSTRKLKVLDLKACVNLSGCLEFPAPMTLKGSMKQLETLSVHGCKQLGEITDSIGGLQSLLHLALDDAIIEKLPRSIGELAKLESLSLRNCQNLLELPDSVGGLDRYLI